MCLLQLVFFLDSLTDNRTKTLKFFKFVCFLFTGIIIIQIAAINVLNIPKFQEEILNKNVINEKIYSVWTQIGINYAYHKKLIYVLKEWIGYLAAVCSLMTLTFSINTIKVNSQNDTKACHLAASCLHCSWAGKCPVPMSVTSSPTAAPATVRYLTLFTSLSVTLPL